MSKFINAQTQVEEFMKKHNYFGFAPATIPEQPLPMRAQANICDALEEVLNLVRDAMNDCPSFKNAVTIRIMLLLEELHEFCVAATHHDEVGVADALADLAYVVLGTAVQFKLPLGALLVEVHRSNMTKTPGVLKPKGEFYEAPQIAQVIEDYRMSLAAPLNDLIETPKEIIKKGKSKKVSKTIKAKKKSKRKSKS